MKYPLLYLYMFKKVPALFLILFMFNLTLFSQEIEVTDEDYNIALEEYSNAQEAYFAKRYKDALLGFNRAHELNPANTDYQLGMALSLYELKEFEKAEDILQEILKIEPNQPDYHQYAGNVAFRLKNYPKAIFHYEEAIRLAQDADKDVILDLGNLFFNCGVSKMLVAQYQGAIDSFSNALKINAENGLTYYYRGFCYLKIENKSQACQDFKLAVKYGEEKAKKYYASCD